METSNHSGGAITIVDTAPSHEQMQHLAAPTYTHPTQWTPGFVHSLEMAKQRVQLKRDFYKDVMAEGLHYGSIPGADKPVLFKPGAELLLSNMGLNPILTDAEKPIRHYGPSEHGDEPIIAYRRVCQVYRQTGPGLQDRVLVAQAEGFCSSRETKYRYRDSKRLCPECNQPAIMVSKFERGGFYCFGKVGGCGVNFDKNDARITSQQVGRAINPDVADLENTILKMADKRAYVAATLLATGCSDIFTQDLEDDFDGDGFGTGAQGGNQLPKQTPKNPPARATRGMTEKQRRRFLQTVGEINLPEAVVIAIVEQKTNKTAHKATDPLLTRPQAQAIVDTLRDIAKQRAEAEAAHAAAEQEGVERDEPVSPATPAGDKQRPAAAARATASASASARAGGAKSTDALRLQIRKVAGERNIPDDELNELAKKASRGYASSLDDPKFNPRDGQALLNLLNGKGGGKYGEPSFAA